ncbi:fructose-bisphosphate aldolase [Clostridia bacterium]|nr:fructose-bisphosphate aldolase [Clostridia bacterium]
METQAYRELGLTDPRPWLKDAYQNGWAVPAFNFVYDQQLLAIVHACALADSPVILQCSASTRRDLGPSAVRRMVQGVLEQAHAEGTPCLAALQLDHGHTYAECRACVEEGFSSVMIDGSVLPYEENAALSQRVAEYAHPRGVAVEAELGSLSGIEELDEEGCTQHFTRPAEAGKFVRATGVDILAVSIGTSHGVVKMRPEADGCLPPLRMDIVEAIALLLPGVPLALHGASALPSAYVAQINAHGGRITEAQGVPETEIARLLPTAVCKINNASDGWIAATAAARAALDAHPDSIDPRVFLKAGRAEMERIYTRKVREVFHSAGRASGLRARIML